MKKSKLIVGGLKRLLDLSVRKRKCFLCGLSTKHFEDPKKLKLHFIKCVVNQVTPLLEGFRVEPTKNTTKMLTRIFDKVRKNLAVYPDKAFGDRNFPNLVNAAEKVLVYVAETDRHYRAQVAFALMKTAEEVVAAMKVEERSYSDFCLWLSECPLKFVDEGELKEARAAWR